MIRRTIASFLWWISHVLMKASLRIVGARLGRVTFASSRDAVDFEPGMVLRVSHGDGYVGMVSPRPQPNRGLN